MMPRSRPTKQRRSWRALSKNRTGAAEAAAGGRRNGPGRRVAVLEAGPTRMRPVLMTALSTICGMLPVAFGQGGGSELRNPMGVIAIGGLVTSTVLTLVVVPVAYTLVDDAQTAVVRALRTLRSRSPAPR